jgi:hypothetical protein
VLAPFAFASLVAMGGTAHAQTAPVSAASVPAADRAQAEEQFKKAKGLYLDGRYVEARTALLEARKLDPSAKDLVFNLGVVAEKLLDYDEAITYLREYKAMDAVTEAEAQRADASIRRIEGAKARHPKTAAPLAPVVQPDQPPPPPKHGRVDGLTLGALGLTGAALATGVVFGVLALQANPADTVTTGKNNPFSTVDGDNSRAQTFGLVADIGFGVAIAAAVTTTVLYFARTKDPARTGLLVPVRTARGGWGFSF